MVSGANNTNKPNGDGKSRFPLSALNKNRQLAAAVPATNSKKNIGNAATIAIPPNSVKNTASAPTRTVNVSNVVNAQNTVDALDDFEQPKYHAKKAQTKQTKQAVEEARKEAENPITCATSSDWILDKEKRQERAQIMATQTAKHAYNQAVRLEDERLRKLQENRFTIGQKGVQAPKKARNATVKHGVLFDDQQPGLVTRRFGPQALVGGLWVREGPQVHIPRSKRQVVVLQTALLDHSEPRGQHRHRGCNPEQQRYRSEAHAS